MNHCHACPTPEKCSLRFELGYGCLKAANHERPKGIMIYDHKTGAQLQVVSEDGFKDFKAKTRRVGQKSILRHVTPNQGKPQ